MKIAIVGSLSLCLALVGCDTFERATLHTLSASQSVSSEAQEEYQSEVIPQTNATHYAITAMQKSQATAMQELLTYDDLAQKKEGKDALAAQRKVVNAAMAHLAADQVTLAGYLPK
jgi:hypothetical protein